MSPIMLVLLLLLAPTASPGAAETRNPSPEGLQLEGIYLGQSFTNVDRLLAIRSHTPVLSDRGKHYTWVPPRDSYDLNALDKHPDHARRLRQIQLMFRDKRVAEVRTSYSSAALFTRTDLEQRYGKPNSVVAPPPRGVPGGYALFLKIWTWQWDDATLTVTGEHYRVHRNPQMRTGKHPDVFRFHLKAADDSSARP